jgi:hypothetical protein
MKSRWWGRCVLGATSFLVVLTLFALAKAYHDENAAIALVSRADSGGPVLIPARCDVQGAKLNVDYVIADGKALEGRSTRRTCFYTIAAFKRLFPERYSDDNPVTFRVQQLTTGMRLLAPSSARFTKLVIGAILAPVFMLGLAMIKAAAELVARTQTNGSAET